MELFHCHPQLTQMLERQSVNIQTKAQIQTTH